MQANSKSWSQNAKLQTWYTYKCMLYLSNLDYLELSVKHDSISFRGDYINWRTPSELARRTEIRFNLAGSYIHVLYEYPRQSQDSI